MLLRGAPRRAIVCLVLSACSVSRANAQAPSPPPRIDVSYEVSRDRFHYRFENPSTFNMSVLVPHEFTQTYWGDNQWVAVTGRYRAGRRALESEVAVAPQRDTRGDDFDTFFQPSGDVVVSGTTGDISMWSLRVRQNVGLGEAAGVAWHVGYQYRRDSSVFRARQKIVTHTQPASREVSSIPGREWTTSETHEIAVGVTRQWDSGGRWRVRLAFDLAPTTNARLTTVLPDKYPGEDIVFAGVVMTIRPALTITRATRWPLSFTVRGTKTFSYVNSRQFERTAVTAGVAVGWRR